MNITNHFRLFAICFSDSPGCGAPQCGHLNANFDTSLPQHLHFTNLITP